MHQLHLSNSHCAIQVKNMEKYNSHWKEHCYHQSICCKMAIPGILSVIFCFTSVMSLIIGMEKEGNIERRYNELVKEAEKLSG